MRSQTIGWFRATRIPAWIPLCGAVLALLASFLLRPYVTSAAVLDGKGLLSDARPVVPLARIGSTRIVATQTEVLRTPEGDWPPHARRDAYAIPVSPSADRRVNGRWLDLLLREMSPDHPPEQLRHHITAPDSSDLTAGQLSRQEVRAALDLIRRFEHPESPFVEGDVTAASLPPDVPYAQKTGVRHIFAVVVPDSAAEQHLESEVVARTVPAIGPTLRVSFRRLFAAAEQTHTDHLAIPSPPWVPGADDGEFYSEVLERTSHYAAESQTPRTVYVGAYTPVRAKLPALQKTLSRTWQKEALELKTEDFADGSFRIAVLITLAALAREVLRRRRLSPRLIITFGVMASGFAGAINSAAQAAVKAAAPLGIVALMAAFAALAAGLVLRQLALFDAKEVIKEEIPEARAQTV